MFRYFQEEELDKRNGWEYIVTYRFVSKSKSDTVQYIERRATSTWKLKIKLMRIDILCNFFIGNLDYIADIVIQTYFFVVVALGMTYIQSVTFISRIPRDLHYMRNTVVCRMIL